MSVASVHVWGFFRNDGGRRLPDGGAPSEMSPYDHFCRVRRNVHHFGGELIEIRTTRTLDGDFVGIEFETPERHDGKAAHMWHVISEPRTPWGDPTAPAHPQEPTDLAPEDSGERGGAGE